MNLFHLSSRLCLSALSIFTSSYPESTITKKYNFMLVARALNNNKHSHWILIILLLIHPTRSPKC